MRVCVGRGGSAALRKPDSVLSERVYGEGRGATGWVCVGLGG